MFFAEVTVALALAQPGVRTVVTDSKTAYASYRKGKISPAVLTILAKRKSPGRAVELVWNPDNSQVEDNCDEVGDRGRACVGKSVDDDEVNLEDEMTDRG